MEYKLKRTDEVIPVSVETESDNSFNAVLDREAYRVEYRCISDHHLFLTVNGRGYNVYVSDDAGGKTLVLNGHAYQIQDADEQARKPSRKKGAQSRPTDVTPLTPSLVVSVLVAEGDAVEEGQSVVVLSAMKMESTLTAPHAGTVKRVNAAEGDKVAPGQILVEIEKTQSDA